MAATKFVRTTGISDGDVDMDAKEIRFALDTDGGRVELTANLGAAQQILSALAPMEATLRENFNQPGARYSSSAEAVAEANVAIERFDRLVMLLLVTDKGIPHTFSLTIEAADEIAARLKKESKRLRTQTRGRA